jgi:hypothetical protein
MESRFASFCESTTSRNKLPKDPLLFLLVDMFINLPAEREYGRLPQERMWLKGVGTFGRSGFERASYESRSTRFSTTHPTPIVASQGRSVFLLISAGIWNVKRQQERQCEPSRRFGEKTSESDRQNDTAKKTGQQTQYATRQQQDASHHEIPKPRHKTAPRLSAISNRTAARKRRALH